MRISVWEFFQDALQRRKENSMNSKDRAYRSIFAAVVFLVAVAVVFSGCKKEEPVVQQQASDSHDGHDHEHPHEAVVQEATTATQETAEEVNVQVAAATEQTTCPVMAGNPINKDLFVEYKGKKVYFCCKGCEEKFLADPAQYIAKLPQFKE